MDRVTLAKFAAALSLSLTLGACASIAPAGQTPTTQAKAAEAAPKSANDDGMICRMESAIGSNRMKRVCRSAAEVEKTARDTQEQMRRMQKSGARAGN